MKRVIALILCFCMLFSQVCSAQAIVLPKALTRIEAEAFAGDKSVKGQLTLPEKVQSIGDRAFADTDVFRMIVPASTTSIGSGILEGSGATYAVVHNGNPDTLAPDAFSGVRAVLTHMGGSIEENSSAVVYDIDSCDGDGNFVYLVDEETNTAQVILPVNEHYEGEIYIPDSTGVADVTSVGPYAFSDISVDGFIVLPEGIELPEERVNWPENIVSVDVSNIQVEALINGQPGKDYSDWYTGINYDLDKEQGYTEDWIDFGYQFVNDLSEAEMEAYSSMIETTIIVDDMNDKDEEHDENVVRVYADGRLVAVNEGCAYITCIVSLNGVELSRARASVYVHGMVPMNVSSVQLSIGEQTRLYPIVDTSDLDPISIRYYSEDDSVADVDPETGIVTAKGPGSTKIIAEAYCYIIQKSAFYRTCTAECMVTVVDGAFTADRTELSLYGGESYDIAFINNTGKTITRVDWESSNAGAVFAKVYEDCTGATITTENGYAYPGHDRITFTATFEDGTTESFTVHVAGETMVVYAEADWPYYQPYSGSEPIKFQYFVNYAPGYSAENVSVRYEVEVLECSSEGVELVTVDDDGYISVTDDVSVTGVANVYAIFEYDGRQVARIKSGVIVNQGIPAIEQGDLAFTQDTFHISMEAFWDGNYDEYPFHLTVSDENIWDYYYPVYEVVSEDDHNDETEDDTGLVLGVNEGGYLEYFDLGTARIRATLVPHNPAEVYNVITAEATVEVYKPYLAYETYDYVLTSNNEHGVFGEGEYDPMFQYETVYVYLMGIPEGVKVERVDWHLDERLYPITERGEKDGMPYIAFYPDGWSEDGNTIAVEARLASGSDIYLEYPFSSRALEDYEGAYLDKMSVQLSVGDEFRIEAYNEEWNDEIGESYRDYGYYDYLVINLEDFMAMDEDGNWITDENGNVIMYAEPVGGEWYESEWEEGLFWRTDTIRATNVGETTYDVHAFRYNEYYDTYDRYQIVGYVKVVEPEMTLEAFEPVTTMFVGNTYDPSVALSYNGVHPEITFAFSEPGILKMDYDAWKLVPVGAGTVDVTVTLTKGDLEPQSMTKTITVRDEGVYFFEGKHLTMSAGGADIASLRNATDKEIDHILWQTSDYNTVSLFDPAEDSMYDPETGDYISSLENTSTVAYLIANSSGSATLTATVFFTDGTSMSAFMLIDVESRDEGHFDIYVRNGANTEAGHIELSPNETYELDWDWDGWMLNDMSFYSHNSDIASVSAQGIITAVAPGETTIDLYGYAGELDDWEEVTVVVRDFTAQLLPSELNLSMGEAAYLVPQTSVEDGYWINDQHTGFWSTDESVATVDHMGLVTAVAPGSATIGYEAYTFVTEDIPDEHRLVAYATVNVAAEESGVIALSETNVELHARERYQLGVCVTDNYIEEKAIESVEWVSSDGDWLSVDETGLLYAFFWDIEEPRTVYVTANVTFTDGTTDSIICSVKLLPARVSVAHSRNFYELRVGQSKLFEYTLSRNENAPSYEIRFSVDEEVGDTLPVIELDEIHGVVTGVNPGVALVRMNVYELRLMNLDDEDLVELTNEDGSTSYGRLLFTGASYFYVDTPLPEPTEGCVGFEFDHYYLTDDDARANIFDQDGIAMYYNVCFSSDDEGIVTISGDGWIEPQSEGSTTIRVWLEGYEQFAATAKVTVGDPYVTFDAENYTEDGRPIISVGDQLTVKIENMPPFAGEDKVELDFLNVHSDWNALREVSRNLEENTITFMAMESREDTHLNLEVRLATGWHHTFINNAVINEAEFEGSSSDHRMHMQSVIMSDAEIVDVYPDFGQCGVVEGSVRSTNEGSVTAHVGEENQIVLTGMGAGYAEVYAEYLLANHEGHPIYAEQRDENGETIFDEEGNPLFIQQTDENGELVYDEEGNPCYIIETVVVKISVSVVEDEWDVVSLDGIPSTMYVGHTYEAWPEFYHTGFHGPQIRWWFSEDGVIEQWQDENGAWLKPVQTGTVTLYVQGEKDGEPKPSEPLSMEITVTDAPYNHIEFEHAEVDAPLHNSFFVPLHINTDWDLLNVEYWSEDEGLVQVRNMLDDESYPAEFPDYKGGEAVIITGVADNNSTRIFAKAEFRLPDDTPDDNTDNETYTAYAAMRVNPHEWLDIHVNNVELTSEDWGEFGKQTVAWLDFNTHYDLSKNSEYTLSIQWHHDGNFDVADYVRDENGIPIHEGHDVIANGVVIEARNPGGTDMRVHAAVVRALRDENGEIVLDDDGNVVYNNDDKVIEREYEFHVEVHEPQLHVEFNNPNAGHDEFGTPVFELRGTDNRYHTSWYIHEAWAMNPLTERIWVDDTSVATVGANGELVSVAPGETRVRVRVTTDNGHSVENEAIVRVYGNNNDTGRVDMGFYDDEMTIAAGTSANIAHYLNDNGHDINGEWWSSSDESVATVSKDGTVYGVEKGFAVITWHVDTEYGWHEAKCIVEVTGTSMGAWFAEDMLVLHRGSEATVGLRADGTIDANGGDPIVVVKSLTTSDEDVLKAEVVTDENGRYLLNEEGQPVIHLTATDWDNAKTYYITVTAVVEDYNGELQTATMLVVVPEQRLRIAGRQFGEGRWEHLGLFDWENPLTIYETYYTSDPDMDVEVEVTVDKMHVDNGDGTGTDKTIIVWDPECNGYIGVAEGETTMHYTVTARNGESHTADLKVFVGGEDRMPDELKLREGYKTIVTALGDNNRHIDEAIDWPEYKGCELWYEIIDQQLFYGGEGNVINFNEGDSRIYTENAGTATVRAYCPYNESLSVEIKVLVFGDAILTRVDKDTEHEIVRTGETVELGFRSVSYDEDGNIVRDENGNMVFGEEVSFEALGLEVKTWNDNGFGPDIYKVSDDGMTFKTYFRGEGEDWWHNIGVRFPDGYEWHTNYHYYLTTDNFFRVRLNNYPAEEAFVGNPMERSDGGLGWDSGIQEDYHVFWESENPEIAFVNADGSIQLSGDVTFTEENPSVSTNIIGIARRWVGEGERDFDNLDAWEEIARDSFPVRIIEPTAPNFDINTNGVQTVVVGDTLNMWISEYDEKTNAPTHWFTSSDESKLQFTGNYGEFLALAPGKVTITCEASNGFTEEAIAATTVKKTITIYVVAAEPVVWFEPGFDLRPGQSLYAPVCFDANGTDKTIADIAYTLSEDIADVEVDKENWGFTLSNGRVLDMTDADGNGYTIQDAEFAVTVTLSDGKTFTFNPNLHVRRDEEVAVWGWHEDTFLSADAVIGARPVTGTAWLHFDTTAALTGEENAGTDTAWVEWELVGQWDEHGNELDVNAEGYQPIVTLVGTEGDWNEGAVVQANGIVGSAELKATVRIYNAAGEELDSHEEWMPVYVEPSHFDVWFDNYNDMDEDGTPVYYLDANNENYRLIGWSTREDNVTGSRREIFWSDNTSVVDTDIHGNVQVVAPGETYIHVRIIFGEGEDTRVYDAGARVVVQYGEGNTQRVDLSIDRTHVTLGVDESTKIYAHVNDNGVQIHNQYWFNNNPAVVEVNNDGTVYGVAPGVAMIKYCVETEYGQEEAVCIVEVTGEAAAFRLGSSVVTLFTEQSCDVEIINETGLDLSNVQVHVSNWEPVHAELIEGEDGAQFVRIHANDWGSSITKYETVTVTADTENGPVSANCQVIIPIQKLRIVGNPFENDSNWWGMGSGERRMADCKWVVSEPSLAERVREEVTSDNAEIAYYDEETGEIVAVAQGETVIRYTVWVENEDGSRGETRTGEVVIFVDMDRTPEDVVAVHDPEIVFLDWEYAGLELDYQPFMTHTHTQFVSHNPEILTFDNENENNMHLHGEGLALVEVMFPENDQLNFNAWVLVIDQNNVQVRRVDEGMGAYHIGTLERAHIAFTDANGNQPIWEQYGIPVEYVFSEYDDGYVDIEVDENNQIFLSTTYTHTDSHISHQFGVHFYDDLYLYKNYEYWIDPDVLFSFAFMDSTNGYEYVGVVGERSQTFLSMCENYGELYEKTFGVDYAFRFESDNSSVAQVDDGGWVDLVGEGETTLHVIACEWIPQPTEEEPLAGYFGSEIVVDGNALRASLPVRVLAPYAPNFRIMSENDVRMLNVGEELQLYINRENDPSTYGPQHNFESCDTSILVPVLDENGEQVYGRFKAIAPGRVTVNATAWNTWDEHGDPLYPELVSRDSKEFIVVVQEPDVWMDDIAVRPGQTYTLPVGYNDNGTGIGIASVSVELGEAIADAAVNEDNEIVFTNARTIPVEGEEFVIQDAKLTTTITLTNGTEHVRESNVHITVDEEIWVAPWHDEIWLSTESYGEHPMETVVWQSWHHNAAHYDEENPGTDTAWITWELVNPTDEATGETIVVAEMNGWFTDEEKFLEENAYRAPWNNGPMVKAVSAGEALLKTTLTLYNAAGDQIGETVHDEIPIRVIAPSMNLHFNAETYELNVGEKRRLDYSDERDHTAPVEIVQFISSRPDIATVDVTGHVTAHAPGEAEITLLVMIGGTQFTAKTTVVVTGLDVRLSSSEITIERGSYAHIEPVYGESEFEAHNVWFESLDTGIATVNNDCYIYGVETGSTVVYCYIDHDFGTLVLPCVVHVTGTEDALALSTHYVELFPEQEQEITYEYTGEGTPVSVRWHIDETYVFAAPITSNGEMTNRAMLIGMGEEPESDHYATLYCFLTVENTAEDGSTYTEEQMDVCLVKVNAASVRINNNQFGPGQWRGMTVDEFEGIWETYTVSDVAAERYGSYMIEREITTENDSVIVYENGGIRAVGQGESWAFYTINLYKTNEDGEKEYLAESYTERRKYFVDMDRTPEWQEARYNPQVVLFEDGQGWLETVSYPEYTGCYTLFSSQNPEVITFENSEDNRFTIHGSGLANVDVVCPGNEHLNFTAQVLVMDMNVLRLTRVDTAEGEDPYTVRPYETVQLGFVQEHTDGEGNIISTEAPLWEQFNIPVYFEVHRNYDPHRLYVTDDLQLTTTWVDFGEEIHHWVDVVFGEGDSEQRFAVRYPFHIVNDETYFYAMLEDDDSALELVMNPGDTHRLDYRTNIEWQDDYTVIYYTDGDDANCISVDAQGNITANYYGMANVHVDILRPSEDGDGSYYYVIGDSFPVHVVEPEVPVIAIHPDEGYTVRMGETVRIYISHENSMTFAPYHHYTSMDENILEQVYDENGDPVFGLFRAVGFGNVEVRADAHYGYESQGYAASTSACFHVIPGNASVSFEQDYVEMRPGQTMTLPVYFNANGSEDKLDSFTCSVTDDKIISAEMTELEDGTAAVKVTRLAVSGDAQVNVQALLTDGSTRGGACTIGVATDIYLNLSEQTIFLYTDEADGPTEADVYLTWETNAALAGDENPGTDTLWIDWSNTSSAIATNEDIGADTATNNGVTVKAVAQGLTSFIGYVKVKDVYGTVIAEGEAKVSVYVCSDRVNVTLTDAPEATEYVGNVGDAAQISWTTDEWSGEEDLPEGYSVLYKEVDQYGNETGVVTVDQYGWFYPQTEGETNIQVRIRESYVSETNGNTYYRTVAAGTFHVRVIAPEVPNVTITTDRDVLTVGETVKFDITFDNSNTFPPFIYFMVDETSLDPVKTGEGDEIHGLYYVYDMPESGETTITAFATYGTSTANAQSETSITLPVQAGSPDVELPFMSDEMRPGQVIVTPVYYNDNATGIDVVNWSVTSSDEEILVVERTELDDEEAIRVTCLAGGRDAFLTVKVELKNGDSFEKFYDVHPLGNDEIWVDAYDGELWLSDASFGMDDHEMFAYIGYGTNAAAKDDPNRLGTDYVEITDWWAENPEGVTVITTGETVGDNGNGVFVRGEVPGTAKLHATVKVYAEDGTFLAKDEAVITVYVSEATMDVWFDWDSYGFNVGQGGWIEAKRSSYVMADTVIHSSSDENVFTVDIWGNITPIAPGQATYTVTYVYGDKEFSASTQVEVWGVELRLLETEITLAEGESYSIPYVLNKNGYVYGDTYENWNSSDNSIATVTDDGKVYAVAPGTAAVTFEYGYSSGYFERTCLVHVTGEESGLVLSDNALTVYPTNTAQLTYAYVGEGALDESSIVWSSSEDWITVEDGLVAAIWQENASETFTAVITCEAQVNMGTDEEPDWQTVSDTCHVTMPAPKVWIGESLFYEGSWFEMEIGEAVGVWENYTVTDSSLIVEETVSVDKPEVAVYEEEYNHIRATGNGIATATYTLTAYRMGEDGQLVPTGESYTRTMAIVVGQNTKPAEVKARYETQMVNLSWGSNAELEIEYVPQEGEQYAYCNLLFESDNHDVVSFRHEEDPFMEVHGEGVANITITCPDDPALNDTAKVLVVNGDALQLVTLEGNDTTNVRPYEPTKLGIRNVYWDSESNVIRELPVWEREGVEVSYRINTENDDQITITDDLTLTLKQVSSGRYVNVAVLFGGGQELYMGSHFYPIVWEPFFIATVNGNWTEVTANPGDMLGIGWHDNLYGYYGDCSISFESSKPDVARVEQGWLQCYSLGEATITVIAKNEAGETVMTSEIEVSVVAPQTPDFWIVAPNRAVKLGQTVHIGIDHARNQTIAPNHFFTSLNPEVLEQVYDEYGNEQYGTFRAVGFGEAVIRAEGSYGHGEDVKTSEAFETFYVIPGDPELVLESEDGLYTLRPGQTRTMTVRFEDNGSGMELAENPQYSMWVDYGDSVTVTDDLLEDGTYTITVTAHDANSSPLINVRALLSDGSEVVTGQWMSMVNDWNVYLNINHDQGISSADICDEPYGTCGQYADFRVAVDTNAYLAAGADQLEITWWTDNPAIQLDTETVADEYGNGVRVTGIKDMSGSGNVYADVKLTTASGSVHQNQLSFWVNVYDTYCNIQFGQDAYELTVGDTAYLDVYPQSSMALHQVERLIYVDDPSVAHVYNSQYIRAAAPGTANLVCRVVFENGEVVEASIPVTVYGAKAEWADASMENVTLDLGENNKVTLTPSVILPDNGLCVANDSDSYWENTNGNVVSINEETGEITALNPGTAVVSYWQNLSYYTDESMTSSNWGECFVYSTITVKGEAPVSLSESQITLAGEGTHQLEVIVNDNSHGELTEVRWNAWDHTYVDGNGLVSVNSDHRVFYGTVTATAVFGDGFEYTAACTVTVNPRRFNPYGWQFNNGNWAWMAYNSTYDYRDMVEVFDRNVDVEMTFESSNTDIATVDEYGNIYSHNVQGHADITVTMRGLENEVYTGESYVRSFRVRVEEDTTPSWMEYGNDQTWVVPLYWDTYNLPYSVEPYTSWSCEMTSDNPSVAYFNYPYEQTIQLAGTGEANLTMTIQDTELTDTAKLIVIDPNQLSITAEDGRTEFGEYEEVQLVVNGLGAVESEVSTISWYTGDAYDSFWVDSDGVLMTESDYGNSGQNSVWADVIFNCGTSIAVPSFYFDIVL